MATVKFPLEMKDGAKVRTLEDLREHFDAESVVAAFQNGKLLKWLEARYYDKEAEKVRSIDTGAENWQQHLFNVLGVESVAGGDVDEDVAARLNEKKKELGYLTNDKAIISNADCTALNQEDLADLLDRGVSKIYLVAAEDATYRIPVKKENRQYIGILGEPKVEIDADNPEALKKRNIAFECVKLPAHLQQQSRHVKEGTKICAACGSEIDASATTCEMCGQLPDERTASSSSPSVKKRRTSAKITIEELREMFMEEFYPHRVRKSQPDALSKFLSHGFQGMIDDVLRHHTMSDEMKKLKAENEKLLAESFPSVTDDDENSIWTVVGYGGGAEVICDFGETTKKSILRRICQGKYTEDEAVHVFVNDKRTEGWACTIDSFCFYDSESSGIIPYADMRAVRSLGATNRKNEFMEEGLLIIYENDGQLVSQMLKGATVKGYGSCYHKQIVSYLANVGTLYGNRLDDKKALALSDEVLDLEAQRTYNGFLRQFNKDK